MPLVFTRKVGQKILIGDDIEVKVVGRSGNQIRLAVTAPPSVDILREEIADKRPKKRE